MADELIGGIINPAVAPLNAQERVRQLFQRFQQTTPGAQPVQKDRAHQLFQRFQQHVQSSAWNSLAKLRDEVGMPAFEALMSHAIDKKAIPDQIAYGLLGDQGRKRLAARRSKTDPPLPQRNMIYSPRSGAIPNAYPGPLIPKGEIKNDMPGLPDPNDPLAWQRET